MSTGTLKHYNSINLKTDNMRFLSVVVVLAISLTGYSQDSVHLRKGAPIKKEAGIFAEVYKTVETPMGVMVENSNYSDSYISISFEGGVYYVPKVWLHELFNREKHDSINREIAKENAKNRKGSYLGSLVDKYEREKRGSYTSPDYSRLIRSYQRSIQQYQNLMSIESDPTMRAIYRVAIANAKISIQDLRDR